MATLCSLEMQKPHHQRTGDTKDKNSNKGMRNDESSGCSLGLTRVMDCRKIDFFEKPEKRLLGHIS
jgi:hypothetical protein